MKLRIIPRLDIKGPNLVKGIHLEGLRVLGRPELFARQYYKDGADELIYIDVVASLYGRNNLADIVSRAAQHIFIPLTVGGGVRSVQDMHMLLRAGADKIAINTAAIKNPRLISDGARVFGSQCIVLYIEARHRGAGKYECLTDNAREKSGWDVFDWVRKGVDLGAGEILLTSVDREGTGKGYDIELISKVAEMAEVPVIAAGGAGDKDHVREAVMCGMADAVCAASVFHYALLEDMERSGEYKEEGNVEFLQRRLPIVNHQRRSIAPTTIKDLKFFLSDAGIPCRIMRARPGAQHLAAAQKKANG